MNAKHVKKIVAAHDYWTADIVSAVYFPQGKRMKKDKVKKERLTRYDRLAMAVVQDHGHLSTSDITRHRQVLNCKLEVADAEISEITTRLQWARENRAKIEAQLNGFVMVIEKRRC